MKSLNTRIVHIDAIRVFSIFCIILIHATAYINDIYGSDTYVTILGNLSRLSVSLFVFLSGFCLAIRYKDSPVTTKKFLIHNFQKMLPAYIIWNLIYQIHYQGSINFNLTGLKNIIYGNVASHLYFVPVIIGLYLVFPFLWKHKNKILLLLIIAFVIQVSAQIARNYAFQYKLPIAKDARAFFPLFLGYFVLGIFCAINFNKFEAIIHKYSFGFIIASVLSFILNTIAPNDITFQLYYLLSIPTVFIVFRNASNPIFSNLAINGYYIFLIHHFILDYLVKYIKNSFVPPAIFSVFITLLTYGLCFLSSMLYLNIKSIIKSKCVYRNIRTAIPETSGHETGGIRTLCRLT